MLQLLLERGQSYADLASVLGIDEADVRARARAALTELAGVDPDRNVGLTDYLLGQADPIGRADAVRHLKDDPGDLALATEISQKLLLVAPEATLPRLPGEERRPRPRGAARVPIPQRLRREPRPAGEPGPRTTLTKRQTQIAVVLGCAAVLLVVGVLAIAGVFSSSSESSGGNATTTAASTTRNLATVRLKAQAGASASGLARFALENGQQAVVDIALKGLKPPPADQTYVIWLLLTPNQGYPLSPIRPCGPNQSEPCLSAAGTYVNRFPIPPATLAIVTRAQLVDVSLAPTAAVRSAIQTAIKQKQIVISRPGTSVLRGAIPKAKGSKRSGGSKG